MESITIKEAAEMLGVSVDTIRRRISDKRIRAKKIQGKYGKQWAIDPKSLAEFQQVIEVVPVKYELDPNTMLELTERTISNSIAEAMQEHNKEIQSLRNEVQALRELLEHQQEDKEVITLGQRIKDLFKTNK